MKEEMLFEIVKKKFNAKLTIRNGCINAEDWEKNVEWHGALDKPSWETMLDFEKQYKTLYDSQEYARKRKAEYDKLNQFELIGEDSINGTTNHKNAILAIKAKHPKP